MERAVLLAMATWIGGVGAWAVGAGYALAKGGQHIRPPLSAGSSPMRMLEQQNDDPVEVEVDVLPAPRPPQELSAPRDEPPAADSSSELSLARGADGELQLIKPKDLDMGSMLTESQKQRLAPVSPLKRSTRRSRKKVIQKEPDGKFVPLVPGARSSTEESIVSAFTGDSIDIKREQGEDYYVDPKLVQAKLDKAEAEKARQKEYASKKDAYATDKLKQELAAPFKNNYITAIIVGFGVVAVFFAAFPGLLEENLSPSIASFPDSL